jgi:D-amino-acid dehydrogenase
MDLPTTPDAPDRAPTDVLVVGGGIIGVACAWELAQRGLSVTLIDKRQIGHGCSYGNAGWITPCFALPLPMPGMLLKSIHWLCDPDSPLYIKPRPSWLLATWLWRFLRSMNRQLAQQSITALVALSKHSLQTYRQLAADPSSDFGFQQKGLLIVANTAAGLDAAVREMHLVAPHGVDGRGLSEAEVRGLEPAVTGEPITGGVVFPGEAHVDPLKTVWTIHDRCVALGATILPQTELVSLEVSPRRIARAVTTRGTITADRYVLATGAWSHEIAGTLGLNVPVLSGKGYSIITESFEPAPRMPILLIEKKVAVTPMGHHTKLAGTLELVGTDESITARRVEAIVRGARQFLNVPETPKIVELWRGLRPCTPDGVPIIGRSTKFENLFLATGHQMLGLQTAPATGRLLADLVEGASPFLDPAPFAPGRFRA